MFRNLAYFSGELRCMAYGSRALFHFMVGCVALAGGADIAAASAVFDAIWNIKPRLFGLSGVANPRDSYGYRYGLRLAQTKNPSVLFVPSSIKHCTIDPAL